MTASAEAPGGTGRPAVAVRRPLSVPTQVGRVPDFFIVGNPKCGTTALYEMLRSHPQVYMPALKEPHFLAAGPSSTRGPAPQLPRTLAEYLALFSAARPDQLAGEASPSYLRSPIAAQRIAELNPRARAVAILREPAGFLRSLHLQHLQDHVERERDLRRALANEHVVHDGVSVRRYSDRVRYVEHLRRYEEALGRERMLVLVYEDFRRDNEAVLRELLRFLGVDETVALEAVEANPSVRMRSVRLARSLHALRIGHGPVLGPLGAAVKALTPQAARSRALLLVRRHALYGAPGAPDERLMLELRRRFAPEVVALSQYLGRDLVSLWGYDRLD
jgi:hypothetical protein